VVKKTVCISERRQHSTVNRLTVSLWILRCAQNDRKDKLRIEYTPTFQTCLLLLP
jgi:hypothetical protein